MQSNKMIFALLLMLLWSSACKKEEEQAATEPPTAAPEKVEKADKAKSASAKAPKDRKLVKRNRAKRVKKADSKDSKKAEPANKRADSAKGSDKAAPKGPSKAAQGLVPTPNLGPRIRQQRPQAERQAPPVIGPGKVAGNVPRKKPNTGAGRGIIPSSHRAKPNAELLLRSQDLREILGHKKSVDVHQLGGAESNEPDYDGIFWGKPDGSDFVVGLQVWRPRSPIEAQRRYSQMLRSYPNAEETQAVMKKSFLAYWNDFIYLTFFDPGKQTVVNLTCHRKACNSPQKLVQLGTRIKERL